MDYKINPWGWNDNDYLEGTCTSAIIYYFLTDMTRSCLRFLLRHNDSAITVRSCFSTTLSTYIGPVELLSCDTNAQFIPATSLVLRRQDLFAMYSKRHGYALVHLSLKSESKCWYMDHVHKPNASPEQCRRGVYLRWAALPHQYSMHLGVACYMEP